MNTEQGVATPTHSVRGYSCTGHPPAPLKQDDKNLKQSFSPNDLSDPSAHCDPRTQPISSSRDELTGPAALSQHRKKSASAHLRQNLALPRLQIAQRQPQEMGKGSRSISNAQEDVGYLLHGALGKEG